MPFPHRLSSLTSPYATNPFTLNSHTYHHRSALTSLKLATYALDAMRVLNRLEAQAQVSESFHQAIRSACPDWRNPGSLEEDPVDLLVSVMTHSLDTLQGLITQLEEAWLEGPTEPPEPKPQARTTI